jgi:hypothetical protein
MYSKLRQAVSWSRIRTTVISRQAGAALVGNRAGGGQTGTTGAGIAATSGVYDAI